MAFRFLKNFNFTLCTNVHKCVITNMPVLSLNCIVFIYPARVYYRLGLIGLQLDRIKFSIRKMLAGIVAVNAIA